MGTLKEKVMLAMSGGVDSSVALTLLMDKYELVAATLYLHDSELLTGCSSKKDADEAKKTAEKFGVPHYILNYTDDFEKYVTDDFTSSYINGKTPNPCIRCNEYIKFNKLLKKSLELGCDFLATGHYARVEFSEENGRYLLKKSRSEKDQSYVLYRLTQEQLKHIIFPIGDMDKTLVRKLAKDNMLSSADKPDSQDICFIPDGNYADFIEKRCNIVPKKGDFIHTNGEILGQHKGLLNYTIGQRKGLGIAYKEPLYVVEKDITNNNVILGTDNELYKSSLIAENMNWIAFEKLEGEINAVAKTRYHGKDNVCTVSPLPDNKVFVQFREPTRAITAGQHIVFYDDDVVLGGGIIL